MPRYRPGDHVFYQFRRPELLKLQFRTGFSLPPFQVVRVLPADEDGQFTYQVQCPLERTHVLYGNMNSRPLGERRRKISPPLTRLRVRLRALLRLTKRSSDRWKG